MADATDELNTALSDHYRVLQMLGRGGMASVFLAEDLRHHRQVAIKVLDRELAAAIGTKRFLREIEIAAKLTHPHIMPVHDSGTAGDILFYVMPYVAGSSLRERLDREKQLPIEDSVRIVREVADALEYAHRQGVVHRDIKPANLLLVEGHAVVADFGIARAVAAAGERRSTTVGTVIGTPAYMSPEQASGESDVDGRSDLYSLGCVLYELLSGQPPFTGATADAIFHQVRTLEPRPIESLRPSVPVGVSRAVRRSLAKAPADRYQSASEFRAALEGSFTIDPIEGARTVPSPVVAPPSKASPRAWRKPLAIAGAVAVLGTIALLSTVGPFPWKPPGPPSLAVLFFQNFGAARDDDLLAAGLTEDVTTSLSQVPGLRVVSRTAVERYRGQSHAPRRLGRELGVSFLLEGSIRRAGDQLRVTAQLVRAADGMLLWAGRFDGDMATVFAIQDSIATRIAWGLRVPLAPGTRPSIAQRWTDNAQAYAAYLIGRELYFDRQSPDPPAVARPWFEKALVLDPDFAPALVGLADVLAYEPLFARRTPTGLDSALMLARRAQRIDSTLGIAWRAEAHIHVRREDYRKARELFERAIHVDPRVRENYPFLAETCAKLGDWPATEAAIRRGVQLYADWPTTWLMDNRRYLERGDVEASERFLAEGLGRMPGDPLLLLAHSELASRRRQWDVAERDLRLALAAKPDYFRATDALGDVLRRLKRYRESDSVFAAIAARWPRSAYALYQVAQHEGARGRRGVRDSLYRRVVELEPYYYSARKELLWRASEAGGVPAAIEAATELARVWPNDAIACEDIARRLYDLQAYALAEQWARKAVALNPNRASARDQLGWDCIAQGRYDEGVEAIRLATLAYPGAPWVHRSLANALMETGRYAEANAAARRSVELCTDYVDGLRALGNSYNRLRNRFQAAAAYERILTLAPNDVGAMNNLANTYLQQDRVEKAASMYRRAADIDSTAVTPRLNLAAIALERRDGPTARRLGIECVRLGRRTNQDGFALAVVGRSEQLMGHPAAASEWFKRALARTDSLLRINPRNVGLHSFAGSMHARLGNIEAARRESALALKLRGSDASILYNAACIACLCGDREQTFDYLRRAIEAGFDDARTLRTDPDLADVRSDPRFRKLAAPVI